jgi:lysophospholipase L1-like esterase
MSWALVRTVGVALAALVASTAAGPPAHSDERAPEPYEWAAMGDSYTAGLFVGEPLPALGDPDRDGCDRASGSYPGLVARRLDGVELTDVSCGGATIEHIAGVGQVPVSPVEPPAEGWPAVAPQIERAGLDADTDVVTIGIGGNSVPTGEVLQQCLSLGLGLDTEHRSCEEYYTHPPAGVADMAERLERIEGEYAAMLRAVREAAPNAEVIAVGYPAVLPRDSRDCRFLDIREVFSVGHRDIRWVGGLVETLNRIAEEATEAQGGRFVDVNATSLGHDACQDPGTKWIEGLCGEAEDYWPAYAALPEPIGPVPCPRGDRAAGLHPNAAGYANTADQVERAVRAALAT